MLLLFIILFVFIITISIIEDAMRRTTAAPRLVPAIRGLLATGAGRKGALNTALQFHAPLSANMQIVD